MEKITTIHIADGFVEPKIKPEDYISHSDRSIRVKLGSADEIVKPDGNWDDFLPSEETQKKSYDLFGCTVFGALNQIETLEKATKGGTPNYSDRATYILSEITPPGADPQVIYEQIRIHGLLPENELPWTDDLVTLKDYASPNPLFQYLLDKMHAWIYGIKHEWLKGSGTQVSNETIVEKLKYSPIAVSVQAWSFNGEKYVRTGSDTHWTLIYGTYENGDYKCFDSYAPFKKRLDKNFGFRWAKRIWLGPKPPEKLSILERILDTIAKLLRVDLQLLWKKQEIKEIKEEPITPIDEVLPPPVVVEKYKWGTKEEIRGSIWKIAQEEGTDPDLCVKVAECESALDPKCRRVNNDARKSVDRGLFQINSYWHSEVSDADAYDPEMATLFFCKQVKKGFLSDWNASKKCWSKVV